MALISLILTPVVYFYVFYPFLNIISSYHHQKHFDSEAWETNPGLRYEMVDQMKTSDEFKHIDAAKAKTLLGEAEWYSWDDQLKQFDSSRWHYGLGIKPGAFTNTKTNALFVFENGELTDISTYEEEISYENK